MACIRKRRGKWVTDWRDSAGVRRWKTFATKREAEDCLDRERPQSRQRTVCVVPPAITLAAYSDRWLALITATVKPRTLQSYAATLRLHVLPAWGTLRVRDLAKGRIKALLAEKLAGGLSKNSVRIIHATLRTLLRAAVDDGVLVANPADRLGRVLHLVTPKAARQELVKAMTRAQRQAFLLTARGVAPRYAPLFFTLAGTGMRLGEGVALQWEDLDLVGKTIRIERACSAGVVSTPKSGHGRTVDISQPLADTLRRLNVERKTEARQRGEAEIPAWVFLNEAAQPMDESKVRKAMTRVLKAARLPLHFSPHCLRHTYASLMLQQGESPAYVQRQLGHASIQLTVDTYGKWLPSGNAAAVARLDHFVVAHGSHTDTPRRSDLAHFVAPEESGSTVVAKTGYPQGVNAEVVGKIGAGEWGRTTDLLITNQLLCH